MDGGAHFLLRQNANDIVRNRNYIALARIDKRHESAANGRQEHTNTRAQLHWQHKYNGKNLLSPMEQEINQQQQNEMVHFAEERGPVLTADEEPTRGVGGGRAGMRKKCAAGVSRNTKCEGEEKWSRRIATDCSYVTM